MTADDEIVIAYLLFLTLTLAELVGLGDDLVFGIDDLNRRIVWVPPSPEPEPVDYWS